YVLWQRFLRFDPDQTIGGNRDGFVLSAGHCSTLLYALLHLTGVKAVNPKYEVRRSANHDLGNQETDHATHLVVGRTARWLAACDRTSRPKPVATEEASHA